MLVKMTRFIYLYIETTISLLNDDYNQANLFLFYSVGLSYVVDQLDYLSMPTACTTTMLDRTCLGSCKPHSSSATWHASATASSLCLEW